LHRPPLHVVLPASEQLLEPLHVGAAVAQWLAAVNVPPVPLQTVLFAHPLQYTHTPVGHWLSFVHQQSSVYEPLPCGGTPFEQVSAGPLDTVSAVVTTHW
jgi:hypothetical protein